MNCSTVKKAPQSQAFDIFHLVSFSLSLFFVDHQQISRKGFRGSWKEEDDENAPQLCTAPDLGNRRVVFFGGGGRLEFSCGVERHVVFSLFFLSRLPRSIKSSLPQPSNLTALKVTGLVFVCGGGKIKALLRILFDAFIREIGGGFCWTFPTEVATANYCSFLTLRSNSISEIVVPETNFSIPLKDGAPPFRKIPPTFSWNSPESLKIVAN